MQGLYQVLVAPRVAPQPEPTRTMRQDYSALSANEQASIERYHRAEVALSDLPIRAQVFLRRHVISE